MPPVPLVAPLVVPPRFTPVLHSRPPLWGRSRARPPTSAASRNWFTNPPRPRHRGGLVLRSFLPAPHPATVPRPPPKKCRTESHRHASSPVVPPSRAARRRLTVRTGLDRRMLTNASATPAQQSQVAAKTPGGHEPRQPLHFVPAVVTPHARPPEQVLQIFSRSPEEGGGFGKRFGVGWKMADALLPSQPSRSGGAQNRRKREA